uniref:hypothetical protein n=1 Tax=Bacillus thuringiensis TaxID=1428 RepID=UPI001569A916|nr:hypothetical protein [Bacillus thuringiensis]
MDKEGAKPFVLARYGKILCPVLCKALWLRQSMLCMEKKNLGLCPNLQGEKFPLTLFKKKKNEIIVLR